LRCLGKREQEAEHNRAVFLVLPIKRSSAGVWK